jgi:hypothetical protein
LIVVGPSFLLLLGRLLLSATYACPLIARPSANNHTTAFGLVFPLSSWAEGKPILPQLGFAHTNLIAGF